MTVQVNLLPRWYRLRRRRMIRIQRWGMLCGVLLLAQILSANFLGYFAKETRESRRELAGLQQDQQKLRQKIDSLHTQWQELDRRVRLARQLDRKHYWSEVLSMVASNLPERAMLSAVETEPRRGRVQRETIDKNTRRKKSKKKKNDLAMGLMISGIATDHDAVAEFMRALNREGRLGRCILESTNRETFMQGDGVAFTIRTKWK